MLVSAGLLSCHYVLMKPLMWDAHRWLTTYRVHTAPHLSTPEAEHSALPHLNQTCKADHFKQAMVVLTVSVLLFS